MSYIFELRYICLKKLSVFIYKDQLTMIKLLFFDTSSLNNNINTNTAALLVTDCICTVWNNRDSQCDNIFLLKNNFLQRHQYSNFILIDFKM